MGKNGATLGVAAFTVAGGLIGGLFTAGAFSGVGASVGTMIGGMLFAQPQAAGASSVADLKVQRAEPSFLPIVCGGDIDDPLRAGEKLPGGVWLPGLIIATSPDGGITTVPAKPAKSKKSGTGGRLFGAPKPDACDEQYLSCAIAWSEGSDAHPQQLVELLADDEVLFSLEADSNEDGFLERTKVHDAQGREVGWQSDHIRHYYGTETQPVDDVVATWFDGGHAPAFRGCNYSVLVNFRVDSFGHIPTFYGRFSNGMVRRIDQCRFFLERANGLDGETIIPAEAIQLSKISGQSRGWFMTQAGAPRAIAEMVAARSYCALVEHSYAISDVDLANPIVHFLENWELAARDESGDESGGATPRFKRGLTDQISLFSRVDVRFADARNRDENTVSALMPTAQHENTQLFDMPTSDVEEEMAAWAQVTLDASWIAGTPGEVSVLPRRIDVTAGDVVIVPPSEQGSAPAAILVNDRLLGVPGAIGIKGVGWDGEVYRRPPRIVVPPKPADARAWAKPLLFVANTVALDDEMTQEPGVIVAASQTPDYKWEKGVVVEFDRAQGSGWKETDSQSIRARATMGQTRGDWNAGAALGGYDYGASLEVAMFHGNLVTAPETEVRGGANVILFENGLVISFVIAQQIGLTSWGEGIFQLSGIKAGRWGSDDLATGVANGTRFVLLQDEDGEESGGILHKSYDNWAQIGDTRRLRGFMPERRKGEETRAFVCSGENVKPLSPTGIKATRGQDGSLRLQGRSRFRGIDESGWSSNRLSATEPRKSDGYRFDVTLRSNGGAPVGVVRATQDAGASFDWTWSAEQLSALFGGVNPGSLAGSVAMQGALAGRAAAWVQE